MPVFVWLAFAIAALLITASVVDTDPQVTVINTPALPQGTATLVSGAFHGSEWLILGVVVSGIAGYFIWRRWKKKRRLDE